MSLKRPYAEREISGSLEFANSIGESLDVE
jgi:hypothetical protein